MSNKKIDHDHKAEIFIYAGCVFGWSFIEFILKKEGIFYESYCGGDDNNENSQWFAEMSKNHEIGYIASRRFPGEFIAAPLGNESLGEPKDEYTYCSEGQAKFQSIYTWMLIRKVF